MIAVITLPPMDRIGRKNPVKWYLLEWRLAKGLTQESLAERMDTNKGQVSKLESGKQRMNDYWIAAYSHALGIDPGDLLRDPEAPTASDLLRNAPPAVRKTAVALIEALLKQAS